MLKFIKKLFNKKEIARIKELEVENEKLKKELEKLSEYAAEMEYCIEMNEREEEQQELEATTEKCSCGGHLIPMYEDHPNWITICTSCDKRSANTDMSPIKEPA
ncbi:hypothetical protein JUJ52_02880 [Virgibacillus sp. AGTR]|uniref:hypothetical protein n=1 Tax=Virgibacillus sp. AGTR TaxID=2812055 RepID=UPI001D164E84|nr:hypothetical protein [Virgibacillus sp. AGTR]MCC2248901.1 hypothetical protein [Virgibacillus sp. AGTR]